MAKAKVQQGGRVSPRSQRLWAIGVLVGSLALVLTACGTAQTAVAKKDVSRSKTVSVSMWGGAPGMVTNWSKNEVNLYVKKHFGLKFKLSFTDAADVTAKEPLLLASGDYPDVIWAGSFTQEQALKYGQAGELIPLNNLLKKYAPNVWKNIQTAPGFKQDVTAPNGKIYALPPYNYCPHCAFPYQYYINIQDLNKYGLSMPRTTAQFAHVLSVFKQHGLVPLTGSNPISGGGYGQDLITYIMNAFEPYNGPGSNYLTVKNDGKVQFAAAQPGWKAGLEYLHSLYSAGDFSKVALTQESTAVTGLAEEGKVGVVPSAAFSSVEGNYGEKGSNWLDWAAMPALKGPSGKQSAAFLSSGNGIGALCFAITNKATKTQEIRMMKFLNFIWTDEGFLHMVIGVGLNGPVPKGGTGLTPGPAIWGGPVPTSVSKKLDYTNANGETKDIANWYQWGLYYDSVTMRDRQYSPPPLAPTGGQTALQLWTELDYVGHQSKYQLPPGLFVPPADNETYQTEQTNLVNYVEQWTDEFITGAKSISGEWNGYLKGLDSLGVKNYLKITQEVAHPANTDVPLDQQSPSDVKFLLCKGPIPALQKKYLLESGVPASDFTCSK